MKQGVIAMLSDLQILPVSIFAAMMASFFVAMVFGVLSTRDKSAD